MRAIKYRGKIGEHWAYATPDNVIPPDGVGYWDWEQFWHLVDMETVGQFIDCRDKQGCNIYEGDIVQTAHSFAVSQGKAQVIIEHLTCGIRWLPPVHPDDAGFHPLYDPSEDPDDTGQLHWDLSEFEIIGDIYDNPELLIEGQTS